MSRYKLYKKGFERIKGWIFIIPSIEIQTNVPSLYYKNFEIIFHFLVFHARFLWLEEGAICVEK